MIEPRSLVLVTFVSIWTGGVAGQSTSQPGDLKLKPGAPEAVASLFRDLMTTKAKMVADARADYDRANAAYEAAAKAPKRSGRAGEAQKVDLDALWNDSENAKARLLRVADRNYLPLVEADRENMKTGFLGKASRATIANIAGANDAIIDLGFTAVDGSAKLAWVQGLNTVGLADGDKLPQGVVLVAVGTKTYPIAGEGRSTVTLFSAVDLGGWIDSN